MSAKSPEEIASEIMGYDATDNDGRMPSEPEQLEALIAKGIEADRAQRKITGKQYDAIIEAIDRAKSDDRSLDSDEYATIVVEALGLPVESYADQFAVRWAEEDAS